ncbi:M20/M25/M40 family metallo-hydrolase [Pelomonas sp. SE-A7]|uniref:M20/M25/M40 family metallo-hydrolase n=1 Tax=Pelomonas sp. SE-A7 TaxID=3054953 RepID=UPI00259D2FD9|nr:M20/M25/M40 family metallo-hydrolase [Pelomonas sp. SE-A7]MDM4766182.1 M20/M25/M40 family metallo-hydrolase [Pelomonas sp. SE-A7]
MPTLNKLSLALAASLLIPALAWAAKPEPEVVNAIRDQGFNHSQVMQTLYQLTDKIGPRLTNSPKMREATRWTQDQLMAWGLSNVHQEAFEFGRGWSYDHANVDLLSPRKTSLQTIPLAWTPGTNGTVEAEVVYLDAVTEAELQKFKGKLKGKVVMLNEPTESEEPRREISKRYSSAELAEMRNFDIKSTASQGQQPPVDSIEQRRKSNRFSEARDAFLKAEGVAGALFRSSWDGGLIRVMGQSHRVGKTFPVPGLMLPVEHYNMLGRMLDNGQTPKISFNVVARFHDEDVNAHNVMAEIPGQGDKPELVMLGAHLDSWHGATGGVDNGAGVAITMEAIRILKAVGFSPKRTIRLGLWAGEEQGLLGSAAYVEQHFATRPKPSDPKERELSRWLWSSPGWPISKLADHERFSLYFNVDNGSGKLRGITTQGNAAARSTFAEWFGQVSDLSDGTISNNSTGSTDHVSFDNVGLPGFQFIQDPLDYFTRLHHTHVDSADHVIPEDMKQAAVVLATLVYNASIADNKLPRKPMPIEPTAEEKADSKAKADKRSRNKERKALNDLK